MNYITEQGIQKGQSGGSHVFTFRYTEFAAMVEYSNGDFKNFGKLAGGNSHLRIRKEARTRHIIHELQLFIYR